MAIRLLIVYSTCFIITNPLLSFYHINNLTWILYIFILSYAWCHTYSSVDYIPQLCPSWCSWLLLTEQSLWWEPYHNLPTQESDQAQSSQVNYFLKNVRKLQIIFRFVKTCIKFDCFEIYKFLTGRWFPWRKSF